MHRTMRSIAIIALLAVVFSSCNSKPDHRKFIPKDASVVVGVNLNALSKKIAWNVITGSKLFKEMESRMHSSSGSSVMSGIDKAGVDVMNTFYVYVKPDSRFSTGMQVTAIVPLSDADEWEAYIKKNFPKAEVQQHNKLKMANMEGDMYLGWNKHVLIVMNALAGNSDMGAELDNVFNIADDNSIKSDKHFESLQGAGHDLSMWVNYAQIMNTYNDRMASQSPVAISPSMWKETAFACGFDFVKGKITGDMAYYTSKSLEEIYKEFGAKNVDNDMVSRLPGKNLDMLMAIHFSPKAMRAMMDSTGMLGLANGQLQAQGTNVDNILDAFTGDMAFLVNDLQIGSNTSATDGYQSPFQYNNYCMSVVMKVNKKDNFSKLMEFAPQVGMLPVADGYTLPVTAKDSVFVVYNGDYAVFSNKYGNASAILHGKTEQQLAPALASETKGHPFNLFVDVQEAVRQIDISKALSTGDVAMLEESKKLLSSISFNGGEYKNNAMQGHMEINFTNKEENSIITLLDYGMRMSDAMQPRRYYDADSTAKPAL